MGWTREGLIHNGKLESECRMQHGKKKHRMQDGKVGSEIMMQDGKLGRECKFQDGNVERGYDALWEVGK